MVRAPILGPLCVLGLLCGGASGCSDGGDAADAGQGGPRVSWGPAFDTAGVGALSGVWGTGPDDVFAVGGRPEKGEVYHFDGQSWEPMDLPAGVSLLVWVYGFSPRDVYAVGVGGSAVHFDGRAWAALDSGTHEDLWGVWGADPGQLWVVGGTVGHGEPEILRLRDGTFTPVPLDKAENTRDASAIFKVWGIGDRVFAVGEAGLILRWDGQKWRAESAGAKANDDFVSLWGTSPEHIVAVGGRAGARVATYDGVSWNTDQPSATPGLNAVYMPRPGEAIVGGIVGYVGRFDLRTRTLTQESYELEDTIHAIWCDGAGRCYGVGGLFVEPYKGRAWVRWARGG